MLSRVQGIKYTSTYRPVSEAVALAEIYVREGDVEKELFYSLRANLGDENSVSVPKPWDHDQFPDIVPEGAEVSLCGVYTR